MFNDIFGEVLWNDLIVDKPTDTGKIQATRNGNFLMKCRLLKIFNFFLKCRILLFLEAPKKYIKFFESALIMKLLESLCSYILYTGCPKQKFGVGVLGTVGTQATVLIKCSQSW